MSKTQPKLTAVESVLAMNDELKPCPFCGKTSHSVVKRGLEDEAYYLIECHHASNPGATFIGAHARSQSDAVAAWNNRAEVPAGWRPFPQHIDPQKPPFDGTPFLVRGVLDWDCECDEYGEDYPAPCRKGEIYVGFMSWQKDLVWLYGKSEIIRHPTHWMPLPALPESEVG